MIHPDNRIHPDLSLAEDEDYPAELVAYAGSVERGTHYDLHSHRRAQLFHIVSGGVRVETEHGTFVVPPERAVWIPSNVPHAVTYLDETAQRFLFLKPEAASHLPSTPAVVRLSPLLRELTLAFLTYPRAEGARDAAGRIAAVILDQMATEPIAPLHLPMPRSERLRRVLAEVAADPAGSSSLAEVARRSAFSERSFERHLHGEIGLSYRAWLRQARLVKAIELLSVRLPVSEVADRLGYEQPSAFVAGFRRAFGVTPGRYFATTASAIE